MTGVRSAITRIVHQENINFLLTNRIPRRYATRFMGWFTQIEQPLVRDVSIAVWRLFADLDLSDAETTCFRSLHDCFVRRLKPDARPIDPDPAVIVSPCDAIVGASGAVAAGHALQIKGFSYSLRDLFGSEGAAADYYDGVYTTLRLTSSMYHHFHAPYACHIGSVTYISGDTWNVNPIALKRVERLFCRNERAVLRTQIATGGHAVTLVAVAAILVASIRLSFLDDAFDLRAGGPSTLACDVNLAKGDEMGWFQHGSTILLFAPRGFALCPEVTQGARIRVGQRLMRLPAATAG